MRTTVAAAIMVACIGCATFSEIRIAEDGYLVRRSADMQLPEGPAGCRDVVLLRSAELTLANGYRYFTASTPPTIEEKSCEVHVRMFHNRPECDYAVFYDAAVTQKSLEAFLAPQK